MIIHDYGLELCLKAKFKHKAEAAEALKICSNTERKGIFEEKKV